MPDEKVFEIDPKDVKTLMAKLDAMTKDKVIISSLTSGAVHIADWIKTKRLSGPHPEFLERRSGNLARSIVATRAVKNGNAYMSKIGVTPIGKTSIYAPVHEYGKVIKAKNAPYLTFPVISWRTQSIKNPGTTLKHPAKMVNWVRVKSVTIPARPFMRPGIQEPENRDWVMQKLISNLEKAVAEAK